MVIHSCRDADLLGHSGRDRITLVASGCDYEQIIWLLAQDGLKVTLLYSTHTGYEPQR
ncbi:hypothetical protein [Teichococcus wenyumeiae]|uniref:hypothetical protein n=1 Tax=Teichococcus wenyumeiae TaxID=2478470 RepID=UPI0013144A90|nr:hypothetical protein [Pseudoroseomonas wenyumeiae]